MTRHSIPRSDSKEKRSKCPEGTSYCSKCDQYKTKDQFYKAKESKIGLQYTCKACVALRLSTPEAKARERARAIRRKPQQDIYHSLPETKAKKAAYEASDRRRAQQEAYIAQKRINNRLQVYGVTDEQYNDMLLLQNHACAICGKPETKTRGGKNLPLSIDHDHETGAVRGLLCQKCNVALGLFRDDLENLSNAIDYLMGFNR